MVKPFSDERRRNSTTLGLSRAWAFGAVLAAVLAASAAPHAQFRSGVNAVEVYAAVVDRSGSPVTGLGRGDFTLLEDGQAQTIGTFAEADFPLSVAVALDRSFSMKSQLPAAVSAARAFLGELRGIDQSMVVGIGSEIETLAPLSTDRAAEMRMLDTLQPWGTTGLHDAIIQSIDSIQAASGRRALVLLSDGNDRYSTASASDALARARRSDVMVYPVALGKTRPPLFAQLATLTGGRSFQPRDPADLVTTMRTIANELRHQYLLGYTPSRPIVAGEEQWRTIAVRVNRADATVRARDGYLAR
jgi:Ca-activated chloride channel family protein